MRGLPWPRAGRTIHHLLHTPLGPVGATLEDRGLRLRLGPPRRGTLRLEVGRLRLRRIEHSVRGQRITTSVPATPDPWLMALLGILLVWAACTVVVLVVRRRRERERGTASLQAP